MSDTKYKEWLELMKDTPKEELLKYHYKLLFKVDKQKEVLDKIKEYIKENANANVDYILELLEEINNGRYN